MTLHFYEIDGCTLGEVSHISLPTLPPGWEIATGTSDDIRVIGAHRWQSRYLLCRCAEVFEGCIGGFLYKIHAYGTAMCHNGPMHHTTFPQSSPEIYISPAGTVSAKMDSYGPIDVLLRRRA
jgi:hypothetical protein